MSIPGNSAGCTQTLNRMSGRKYLSFYIFEKNIWISPDSDKRQQHHKMEDACPIFEPMIGLVAVSCHGGCMMTAGFACECGTSLTTH